MLNLLENKRKKVGRKAEEKERKMKRKEEEG